MSVRPIVLEDAEGYHRVLGVVARERKWLRLQDAPPLERTRAFVSANVARGNPHFVALAEAQVVGWCDIIRDTDPLSNHVGSLGMGLLPEQRGKGIGHELLQAALGASEKTGITRIELSVNATNPAAIALYLGMGFELEGILRGAILLEGEYIDIHLMARLSH